MSFDGILTIESSCPLKRLPNYDILFEKQKHGHLDIPNLAFRINYVEPDLIKEGSDPYDINISLQEVKEKLLKFYLKFDDPSAISSSGFGYDFIEVSLFNGEIFECENGQKIKKTAEPMISKIP